VAANVADPNGPPLKFLLRLEGFESGAGLWMLKKLAAVNSNSQFAKTGKKSLILKKGGKFATAVKKILTPGLNTLDLTLYVKFRSVSKLAKLSLPVKIKKGNQGKWKVIRVAKRPTGKRTRNAWQAVKIPGVDVGEADVVYLSVSLAGGKKAGDKAYVDDVEVIGYRLQ